MAEDITLRQRSMSPTTPASSLASQKIVLIEGAQAIKAAKAFRLALRKPLPKYVTSYAQLLVRFAGAESYPPTLISRLIYTAHEHILCDFGTGDVLQLKQAYRCQMDDTAVPPPPFYYLVSTNFHLWCFCL